MSTKVAVVQAESEWFNPSQGVEKAVTFIQQASEAGCQLLAFPELWIPGYPFFIWLHGTIHNLPNMKKYLACGVEINSPEILRLRKACAQYRIWISIGFAEKKGSSLYMSQVLIDATGSIQNHRRKFMPTGQERTLFGNASGDSLRNVVPTPFGRVGQLQCWEHVLPLLKYHTFSQHEQIHVAAWPAIFPFTGNEHFGMSAEGATVTMQNYAIEGQCFVLFATAVVSAEGGKILDMMFPEGFPEGSFMCPPGGGCSAIFGPDGRPLGHRLGPCEEGLIIADLDLSAVETAKLLLDPVGHYSRPDLIRLIVDDQPVSIVQYISDTTPKQEIVDLRHSDLSED